MPEAERSSKLCFVVSQIGDENSPERVSADWFLEAIVHPVFAGTFPEYIVKRADGITEPGMIDAQVITNLINADIVIADLTNLNPNVFYEIGLRHMTQKPIIHMHEHGQRIPFDVSLYRSFRYSRIRPRDIKAACDDLTEAVKAVHTSGYQVENPVTRTLGKIEFERHASPRDKIVVSEIEGIKVRIKELEEMLLETVSSIPDTVPKSAGSVSYRLIEQIKKAIGSDVHLKFTSQNSRSEKQFRNIISNILNRHNIKFMIESSSADEIYVLASTSDEFDINVLTADVNKHNIMVRYT